jgi:hypothetical protein
MTMTPFVAYLLGASCGMTAATLFCMAIFLHFVEPKGEDRRHS